MNPNIITYLATLVAGVLFIIFRQDTQILDTLTVIAALLFIVPGAVNFVMGLRNSRRGEKHWTTTFGLMLVSLGAVALGVLMLIFPEFFKNYIAFALGILLVLCGAYQLVWVLRGTGRKEERWFVAVPLLVVAAGVAVMVLQADGMNASLWLATGIVLICYSLNGFAGMKMLTGRRAGKDTDSVIVTR